MQGTGNDFVVIDNRESRYQKKQLIDLTPELCHRSYGIGADGLLVLQKPRLPETDYEMMYRNADGSDAGMCGNGSRCLALLAAKLGMGDKLTFNVHDNTYRARVENRSEVWVDFPFSTKVESLQLDGETDTIYQVYTGTEHIVLETESEFLEDHERLFSKGKQLRHHPRFQQKGTNVNFFSGLETGRISLQTYERGVENLTLACGTGAIASALTWHYIQQEDSKADKIKVKTPGGELYVSFTFDTRNDSYKQIRLGGAATLVFEGTYYV